MYCINYDDVKASIPHTSNLLPVLNVEELDNQCYLAFGKLITFWTMVLWFQLGPYKVDKR